MLAVDLTQQRFERAPVGCWFASLPAFDGVERDIPTHRQPLLGERMAGAVGFEQDGEVGHSVSTINVMLAIPSVNQRDNSLRIALLLSFGHCARLFESVSAADQFGTVKSVVGVDEVIKHGGYPYVGVVYVHHRNSPNVMAGVDVIIVAVDMSGLQEILDLTVVDVTDPIIVAGVVLNKGWLNARNFSGCERVVAIQNDAVCFAVDFESGADGDGVISGGSFFGDDGVIDKSLAADGLDHLTVLWFEALSPPDDP